MNTEGNPADADIELVRRTDDGIFVHYAYVNHDGHTGWASRADNNWVGPEDFVPALRSTFSHLGNIELILQTLNAAQITELMSMNGRAIQGFITAMSIMAAAGVNSVPAPAAPQPAPVPQPRAKMSDIPMFSGGKGKFHERQAEYILWKGKLEAKLTVDRLLYPTETDRIAHAISRLEGNAYALIGNSIENMGKPNGRFQTLDDLITVLDTVYAPTSLRESASEALKGPEGYQKPNEAFSSYYSRIATNLQHAYSESRSQWQFIYDHINTDLRKAMINDKDLSDDTPIHKFVASLTRLSSRLFALKQHERNTQLALSGRNIPANNTNPMTQATTATAIGDPMELDVMNNNRGGPRAPTDPVERERRRINGLCYYCGKAGHISRTCFERSNQAGRGRGQGGRGGRGGRGGYDPYNTGPSNYGWYGPYAPPYQQYPPPPNYGQPNHGQPTPAQVAVMNDIPDQERVKELSEQEKE